MKKSILSLLVLAFAAITSTAMAQEIRQGAVIEFEKDVHDYGDVPYAGNGTYSFVFSNTGTEPLMISDAKGSCGCTVPSWPKEPIAPGASANIDVTYDTKRVGSINKSVTITSNAVNTPVKVIRITGDVLAADTEATPLEEAPIADAVEEVEEVAEAPVVDILPVSLTKKEIKARQKAEKKRLKKEAKARKKAAKLALKKEKEALKAEAKAAN